MAAGFREEMPRFNPVFMRCQVIGEIKENLAEKIDLAAIEVTDRLDVLQVLQGIVDPFYNSDDELIKGQSLGLVHMSCSDGTKLTQLRLRGYITMWHDYDISPSLQNLQDYEEQGMLTDEGATIDALYLRMLGQTTFNRAQAEQTREHFIRWPSVLGDVLGARLSLTL